MGGRVWLVGTKVMPEPGDERGLRRDVPDNCVCRRRPVCSASSRIIPLWAGSSCPVADADHLGLVDDRHGHRHRQVLDYTETFKAVIVVLIGFVVYLVFWVTLMDADLRRGDDRRDVSERTTEPAHRTGVLREERPL